MLDSGETCDRPYHPTFWTVHVHGPDDMVLFDTEAEARSYEAGIADLARAMAHAATPFDPVVTAHVIPPSEPVSSSVDGQAVETRAQQLTRMVADVIAASPCNRDRDIDGHAATECPTAKAVIESLSRTSALRALVELAPDHPRKPVLPESRPVVPPSARVDGETELREVVKRAAAELCTEISRYTVAEENALRVVSLLHQDCWRIGSELQAALERSS